MSIFHVANIVCPTCNMPAEVERSASVNADLRPDLRAAILDGRFQATTCAHCGTRLRLPPHLTYLELGRGVWIAAEPATMLEDWPSLEESVWDVYDRAFGEHASPAARSLVAGVKPRLVFGWPAFREKLICTDLGLDDVTLELLKMSIMRNVNDPPMADQTELRLVGGTPEELEFAWIETLPEERLAGLKVPRDVYDSILENPEPWEPVRAKFDQVFLVDLRRFIAGSEAAERQAA
ncbi:MAG: CpXC domain-containing protein [Acetobacteraceae bacterium]|nr:CpXC domain-containing protein [Acetobacteraceae bacterium]